MKIILLSALTAMTLSGCIIQRGTHISTGERMPITIAENVKVYMQPPTKYKILGQVTGEGSHAFVSKQALVDAAIKRAKKEAALLGANGILLQNVVDKPANTVGFINNMPYTNTAVVTSGTVTDKAVAALAIFVEQE